MLLNQEQLLKLNTDLSKVKAMDELVGKNDIIKKLMKITLQKLLDTELT